MQTKAVSAVIATIMLLMISTSLIGVFYAFSSGMLGATALTGTAQVSQITKQLSYCMRIENVYGNQLYIRNCGKGVIENASLIVAIDDAVLVSSTQTIDENSFGIVNVSGLWQIAPGTHTLKAINGAASSAQASIDVQPNPDGLMGSWGFEEGSGSPTAADSSGNGNIGTLLPIGSEPQWVSGKYGSGLQFDGANDYVDAGNGASLNFDTGDFTIEVWAKASAGTNGRGIINKGGWGSTGYAISESYTPNYKYNFVVRDSGGYKNVYLGLTETWDWKHIVGIKTANHLETWVNGVKVGEYNGVINSLSNPTKAFEIGRSFNPYYFNGIIDEVRIYNRALTPDETVMMRQIN